MLLRVTFVIATLTCLNIGFSAAGWSKIPYSVDYSKNPYKKAPVPVGIAVPVPIGSEATNPSKLLSRSGFIDTREDDPIYLMKVKRAKLRRSNYRRGAGRWGINGGGNEEGSAGSIFMLGGGDNRRRYKEPQQISVQYHDQGDQGNGYGHGGWGPPPPKKTHSSQYLRTPQHEKPGFVQKLIPMFPIKGRFSEIISWFSDPHGHRHGFNKHHDEHDHGHGHGWHK